MSKPIRKRTETQATWNLITGEDSYSGANAQEPTTSRRIQSWLPSDDGQMYREAAEPKFLATFINGPVCALYEFDRNDGTGTIVRTFFAAARSDTTPGTVTSKLYIGSGTPMVWHTVTDVGTLADCPMFVTLGNNLHVSDGVTNWLYDGTTWVADGMSMIDHFQTGSRLTSNIVASPNGLAMAFPQYSGAVSQSGKTVTFVSTAVDPPHPAVQPGDTVVVAGFGVAGYNGTWTLRSSTATGGFFVFTYDAATSGLAPDAGPGTADFRVAVVTTTAAHGFIVGQSVLIAGAGVGGYNGTWIISRVGSTTDFLARIGSISLAASGNGTVTPVTTNVVEEAPAIDTTVAGALTALIGRNYWYTNADETAGRVHESSSSGINPVPSGAVTSKKIAVYQTAGLFTSATGSPTVTITASIDSPGPVVPRLTSNQAGKYLYINGTLIGTIASVSGLTITLVANALATKTVGRAVICDVRATHWHIYASESDGSKVGQYLASVPVTQNLGTFPFYDQSPFISDAANTFLPIFRPVRNDPPPGSRISEVHKYRIFRTRKTRPNFFNFTANEEVLSGTNGDPTESVPGADVNTLSDIINEVSFPDQSAEIRGLRHHGDALYIASEKQVYPLYGESIDDFALSQITAFNVGFAGRYASKSTPHGLDFMSYDRKNFLYPSAAVPVGQNATDLLVEIGRPLRKKFETIDPARLDEVVKEFYFNGRRNWAITGYPDTNGDWHTWVYDFSTGGWFELQRGFSALAVFETSAGVRVLVGGAPDGYVYVIDDLSGTYVSVSDLPESTWRTSLISFGDATHMRVFRYIELEFTTDELENDIQVTYWLDPDDVDDPGPGGVTITLTKIRGAHRYRGWPTGGATCQRMLIEVKAFSSQNGGAIRGAKLTADPIFGLLT